jgi:uncharacterized protein (DUF4415 family)
MRKMRRFNRGITADSDTRELSTDEIRHMRPAHETLQKRIGEVAAAELLKRRGRPPADVTKVATSVRYNRDVLDAFRATGEGCQTRMNDALHEIARHGVMKSRFGGISHSPALPCERCQTRLRSSSIMIVFAEILPHVNPPGDSGRHRHDTALQPIVVVR